MDDECNQMITHNNIPNSNRAQQQDYLVDIQPQHLRQGLLPKTHVAGSHVNTHVSLYLALNLMHSQQGHMDDTLNEIYYPSLVERIHSPLMILFLHDKLCISNNGRYSSPRFDAYSTIGNSTLDSRSLPAHVGDWYSQPLLSLLYHPSFCALIHDTMAPRHGYPPGYRRGLGALTASSSRTSGRGKTRLKSSIGGLQCNQQL
jgi:hypothetical protein